MYALSCLSKGYEATLSSLHPDSVAQSQLFTTSNGSPPDGERFFQALRRQVPSLSAKFHPSMQNRSALHLIYQLFLILSTVIERVVKLVYVPAADSALAHLSRVQLVW